MWTEFPATIWPNICNPSTFIFGILLRICFPTKYQQLAMLVPRSYLLEIAIVPCEAQVPMFRHVHGDLRAIPMTEMPTVVVTHG